MKKTLLCWSALLLLMVGVCHAQLPLKVKYSPLRAIIPARNLPKEVKTMTSNNNIDFIKFEDRYYVAFRTAPTHFPSGKAKIYVISSTDMNNWQFEKEVKLGNDLREPRFLNFNGKLILYFFEGGNSMLHFDPRHLYACTKDTADQWDMKQLDMDGFVPWRVKMHNGKAWMSAYYGKGLYKADHHADLRLFCSDDAMTWKPIAKEAQVSVHGAEEGEFEFDKAGNLWGTVRLEGTGSFGAYIVYADKDSVDKWKLFPTKDKYDSALMFTHDDDIYVISRRNVAGDFEKSPKWFPHKAQHMYNLVSYSLSKKVTALFKLDKENKKLDLVLDFPSTGDNSFPAIVNITDSSYMLLNYSSDINGARKNWFRGQLGKTYIYLTELMFDKPLALKP